MKARERGVALITAILIVAIVAALATSLALGQQVWLRQTQNLVDQAQAEFAQHGALEWAAAALQEDGRNSETGSSDHLAEKWAEPALLPIEGAGISVVITDAQARFNLNNLLQAATQNPDPGQAPARGARPPIDYPGIYRRLLNVLEIDPTLADTLTDALMDWIDPDSVARPNGAEDLDYLNYDPPYRAANQALTSIDELRLIKGYSAEIVEQLRPYVVVLPAGAGTAFPINVNTAEPPVLAALTDRTVGEVEHIDQTRRQNPFTTTAAFDALLGGRRPETGSYDVKSGYFIVSMVTRIGRTQRLTEALIERPIGANQNAGVLWHRQPSFQIVIDEDKT